MNLVFQWSGKFGEAEFFWTARVRREQLMKGWISTTDELVAHFLYVSFFAVALLLKDQVKEMRGSMPQYA